MKTSNRKIFSFIFCLFLLFCLFPSAFADAEIVESGSWGNLRWSLDQNGLLAITGEGEMNYLYTTFESSFLNAWQLYRDSIITVVIGEGITNIAHGAFSYCQNLTQISIPSSVVSIGESAFYECAQVEYIPISKNVSSIGDAAFSGCTKLAEIDIPEGISKIGERTFNKCTSLINIAIPRGVFSIDSGAFCNCESLKSISIPSTVSSIHSNSFNNCRSLTDVYYDSTEESKLFRAGYWSQEGNESFHNASWHYKNDHLVYRSGFCGAKGENLIWTLYDDGLLKISGSGRMADYDGNGGPWGKNYIKTVVIDSGVTSIGKGAFQSIWELTSVIIPESVTRIGDGSFSSCGKLSSIRIPGNITYFGRSPFNACNSIKTVGPLDGGYNLELTWTDCIPAYAFYNCYNLTSITIPEGISTIEQNAFGWCSALEEIIIPSGTTTIAQDVFNNCQNLVTIHLPSSVTTIKDGAFSECPKICDVYYGSTETSREYREEGWSRKYNDSFFSADWYYQEEHNVLKSGICGAAGNNLRWNLFDDGSLEIIGEGDMADYELPYSIPPWQSSAVTASVGEGVTNIDNYAFQGNQKIRCITIPSSINYIGNNAFYNCTSLTDIYYNGTPEQWESIRNIGNISLPQITMVRCVPIQTVSVSYDANGGVNAPETQTKTYGESLKLSETIPIRNGFFFLGWAEGIGVFDPAYLPGDYYTKNTDTTLYAVWAQPDFYMPNALAIIEEEAFANCSFSFVALSEKTTQLQNASFANCHKLKYIYIPDACVSINKDAFNGISNLTILCEPGSYAEYFASRWGFASLPVR